MSFSPGPAARLFNKPYYENLKASLNDGGIICSQGAAKLFKFMYRSYLHLILKFDDHPQYDH